MNIRTKLGFVGCFVKDCEGHKDGLLLFWKEPIQVEVKSYSPRHINTIIQHDFRSWRFTDFYGSPTVENIIFSWQLLKKLGLFPWLIGVDFNEILFDFKKQGGRPCSSNRMQEF